MAGAHCRCSPRSPQLCDWCQSLLDRHQRHSGTTVDTMPGQVIIPRKVYVPPDTLPDDILEGPFLDHVRQYAKEYDWLVYHTWRSKKSEEGFPDLVLVRSRTTNGSGELVFAELKTATGKLSKEQAWWIELLREASQEVYVWAPRDWAAIKARLTRGSA